MPLPYLKDLSDAVIETLESLDESPPESTDSFESKIRNVFCKMDAAYKQTGFNDTKKAERLSYECRHILLILRLFPIELQLAMGPLFKKTLWGFLSIYLDFRMMLFDSQPDKKAFFDKTMREIFILLGKDEETCIWSVLVTSHTLSRCEILKLIARKCTEATKKSTYEHEHYIRMIWVLHLFFSNCKKSELKSESEDVFAQALALKEPAGLCKWMCHHFPGFGWKGMNDAQVHEILVSEKRPKSFFSQVFQTISKDTLQFQTEDEANGAIEDDQASVNSDSTAVKRVNSPKRKESEPLPKIQDDSESSSDTDKTIEESSQPVAEKPGKSPEKQDKSSKEDKSEEREAPTKPTKPTKTLGPRRSKPIIGSAFLDDDDTNDSKVGDENSDNEKEKTNQADKENEKSGVQVEKVAKKIPSPNKLKAIKKKSKKVADAISDGESEESKSDSRARKSVGGKGQKSESDTDVEEKEEIARPKATKSVKRKIIDSDNSDQTKGESDVTVENANDDEDDDDITSSKRRTVKSTKPRPKSAKKPQPKKLKSETPTTNIERVGEVDDDDSELDVLKNLAYADDTKIQKIIDGYMTGPYKYIFDEFEEAKETPGAEPIVCLDRVQLPPPDFEKERTLADVLLKHNKQKAKEQKAGPSKKRKTRR